MRERDIEAHLVKSVKALGGEVRKVKWISRHGAPDRVVMLPQRPTQWVELKATSKLLEPHQAREHERMRRMGQSTWVIAGLDEIAHFLKSMA